MKINLNNHEFSGTLFPNTYSIECIDYLYEDIALVYWDECYWQISYNIPLLRLGSRRYTVYTPSNKKICNAS